MSSTAIMRTEGLSIGYHAKRASTSILSGLDLELKAGEFVCLLGPNGTGKSTLIRTLAGIQTPLAGSIYLNGEAIESIHARERARQLSIVLTDPILAHEMDGYTMVSMGRHPYSGWLGKLNETDHQRIQDAITAAGAEALASRSVNELSDGERQKISIARALAQESSLMLLDEPTAFLDLPRRVEMMHLLRKLAHQKGMAILLSTHDLDLALRFADRLWLASPQSQLTQGRPETLALNGCLGSAFSTEALDWDAHRGSFRTQATHCLKVTLQGEGLNALWTRRALERLGFGISENETDAAFTITIGNTDEWQVKQAGRTITLASIDHLIDWVQSQDWRQKP